MAQGRNAIAHFIRWPMPRRKPTASDELLQRRMNELAQHLALMYGDTDPKVLTALNIMQDILRRLARQRG